MVAMVKAGIVRGASIGFSPLDMRPPDRNGIARVTRALLHEVSMVTIPSLHDALVSERAHATRSAGSRTINAESARRIKARLLLEDFDPVRAQVDRSERARRLQSAFRAGML